MADTRTAIVTGGAQGIGRAIVEGLARSGDHVVIADRSGGDQAAEELRAAGFDVSAVSVDVASAEQTEELAAKVVEQRGRIDVLVNNAALFTTLSPLPFGDITVDDWRRVMDVNVMGPWLCARAVVPAMAEGGGGRIVNIASAAQFKGAPFLLHYVTSKGAVVGFTRALAREVGPSGITVNAVAPGYTLSAGVLANDDHVIPMEDVSLQGRAISRHQVPEDVVGAVHFFASEQAAFVTGQTLVVDGGSYLH